MTAYRYWRLRLTAPNNTTYDTAWVSLAEAALRTSPGGSNALAGASATASSTYAGTAAANSLDGNSATAWASAYPASYPVTLDFDLGSGNSLESADVVECAFKPDEGTAVGVPHYYFAPGAFKWQGKVNSGDSYTDVFEVTLGGGTGTNVHGYANGAWKVFSAFGVVMLATVARRYDGKHVLSGTTTVSGATSVEVRAGGGAWETAAVTAGAFSYALSDIVPGGYDVTFEARDPTHTGVSDSLDKDVPTIHAARMGMNVGFHFTGQRYANIIHNSLLHAIVGGVAYRLLPAGMTGPAESRYLRGDEFPAWDYAFNQPTGAFPSSAKLLHQDAVFQSTRAFGAPPAGARLFANCQYAGMDQPVEIGVGGSEDYAYAVPDWGQRYGPDVTFTNGDAALVAIGLGGSAILSADDDDSAVGLYLPNGSYSVWAAFGDFSGGNDSIAFYDGWPEEGGSLLASVSNTAYSNGQVLDATGTARAEGSWSSAGAAQSLTITNGALVIRKKSGGNACHLRRLQVGITGTVSGYRMQLAAYVEPGDYDLLVTDADGDPCDAYITLGGATWETAYDQALGTGRITIAAYPNSAYLDFTGTGTSGVTKAMPAGRLCISLRHVDETPGKHASIFEKADLVASNFNGPLRTLNVDTINRYPRTGSEARVGPDEMATTQGICLLETTGGEPIAVKVEQCNDLGRDMWLQIHDYLGDDAVHAKLEYARDNLSSSLHVYLELANEIWNNALAFGQTRAMAAEAGDAGLTFGQYKADRIAAMMATARSVFAATPSRLHIVVADQAYGPTAQYENVLDRNDLWDELTENDRFSIASYEPEAPDGATYPVTEAALSALGFGTEGAARQNAIRAQYALSARKGTEHIIARVEWLVGYYKGKGRSFSAIPRMNFYEGGESLDITGSAGWIRDTAAVRYSLGNSDTYDLVHGILSNHNAGTGGDHIYFDLNNGGFTTTRSEYYGLLKEPRYVEGANDTDKFQAFRDVAAALVSLVPAGRIAFLLRGR